MVPMFVALVAVVVWQRRREQRIVAEQLPGFAPGRLDRAERGAAAVEPGRPAGLAGGRCAGARARTSAKAVAEYQAAVTELAFLRDRMARGSVGPSGPLWHERGARAELRRARARAVGPPGGADRRDAPPRPARLDPTAPRPTPAAAARRPPRGAIRPTRLPADPPAPPLTGPCPGRPCNDVA